MEYKVDDKKLNASTFLSFVNQVWQGDYDIERTKEALSKSLFNISSRPPWRHIFRPDCVKNPCNPSGLLRLFALQDKKSISPIRTRRDIKQALKR